MPRRSGTSRLGRPDLEHFRLVGRSGLAAEFEAGVGLAVLEGHYKDRLPAALEVQVSDDGQTWKTVKQIAIVRVVPAEPTYMATNEPITLEFPPCPARHVRLTINKTSGGQPCIDELEIYGPDSDQNLALAGAKASASSCLEGYALALRSIDRLSPEELTLWLTGCGAARRLPGVVAVQGGGELGDATGWIRVRRSSRGQRAADV